MTDRPEKIWAYLYSGARKKGQFLTSNTPVYGSTEYTRSDIAWNEAMEQLTEKGIGEAAVAAAFAALPPDAYGTIGAGEMERVILAAIRAMKREPK